MNLPSLTLPQFHPRNSLNLNRDTLINFASYAEARSNPASPLYIPDDINEYDALVSAAEVAGDDLYGEARDICKFVAGRFTHIFSAGSGAAKLEYRIHQINPEVGITLSEYSDTVVLRLRRVFQKVERVNVDFLDLLNPTEVQFSESSLLLLYRLETDFSNKQWRSILSELHQQGVQDILFIPSATLDIKKIVQLLSRIYPQVLINRRSWISTGYLRTKSTFDTLLRYPYKIQRVIPIGQRRFGWYLKRA